MKFFNFSGLLECVFTHKWGPWKDLVYSGRQARHCVKCNIRKERRYYV